MVNEQEPESEEDEYEMEEEELDSHANEVPSWRRPLAREQGKLNGWTWLDVWQAGFRRQRLFSDCSFVFPKF